MLRKRSFKTLFKIVVPAVLFISAAQGYLLIKKLSLFRPIITKEILVEQFKQSAHRGTRGSFFPSEIEIPYHHRQTKAFVQYSIDPRLQNLAETLFESYRPDYGAFVALDATTGRMLALASYSGHAPEIEDLALKSGLPSASVFKVVTAAAAIAMGKVSMESLLPINGQYHTLYKRNVFMKHPTHWTRYMTLKEAFGKSVNSVFGRLGALFVGPAELRSYAQNFGFNRQIAADFPVEEGRADIPDDEWGRAESASGYTRENTMSPLQGALIAAAIANDGKMMEPFVVQTVLNEKGEPLYEAKPKISSVTVDPQTAWQIRNMMQETVLHGTAKRAFRTFFRQNPLSQSIEVGGKTGTLSGAHPPGKYDWFIGYALDHSNQKIAFAALTIHEKFWRVKSATLVRKAIEAYFPGQVAANP